MNGIRRRNWHEGATFFGPWRTDSPATAEAPRGQWKGPLLGPQLHPVQTSSEPVQGRCADGRDGALPRRPARRPGAAGSRLRVWQAQESHLENQADAARAKGVKARLR